MTKKIIILLFSLVTAFHFIHPTPSQNELLLKVPVRVLTETDTGWEYTKNLKAGDFELHIDGEKSPIVQFHGKNRSMQRIRQGRQFALSFDVTGYDKPLSGVLSHFIHHILTPSDHLLVRSPLHVYKLNASAEKKEIINYIETNLKNDILQYKESKTAAIDNLSQLIKTVEKKLDTKKIGVRSILMFISHYSNQWKNFYISFPGASLESYTDLASRMSMQDRKAEKWLIHFQENSPEIATTVEQYRKISGQLKKYVASKYKNFGDQAASITDSLDNIEKSMRFGEYFPGDQLLNVLLGVNLSYNVLFINRQPLEKSPAAQDPAGAFTGYKEILRDISRKTGGISPDTKNLVKDLEEIKKHTDFYYDLIFKFDGNPADKNIRVTANVPQPNEKTKVHLCYKKKFKKDEFKWLMDYLKLAEKGIGITGYNLEKHRLSFIISGFQRGRSNAGQPGSGLVKVDIRLINDQKETVYETGNTLKTADDSVSISINLPPKYRGYFKLSITISDLVSGKKFESKKYIKLN